MAEFEEKLNSILGNQEAMAQIMSLARSLSGEKQQPREEPEAPPPPPPEERRKEAGGDLSALLGDLDPAMLRMGMQMVQGLQQDDGRTAALLAALRPFLREEKRARLDRALQIARMTRLIQAALGAAGGRGEDGRV